MAEGKKTFVFYSDWINIIREMPDKDAGQLLKHILSYVNDENPETKNILVKMAFAHMKPILKSDLEKWNSIRQKRQKAGKKGGKANAKQKQANAKQVEAVNVNVNVDKHSLSYTKIDFLSDWNTLRTQILKKPSHVKTIPYFLTEDLNEILNNYKREQVQTALKGLFKQTNLPNNNTSLQSDPKHFLQNFGRYLQAGLDMNSKLYGTND